MQHFWVHVRRDYITCAAGQDSLTRWCDQWIERIAGIYRLNRARLHEYDPGSATQTTAFATAQDALKKALDALFAEAGRELAALPKDARQRKPLRSMIKHREGLTGSSTIRSSPWTTISRRQSSGLPSSDASSASDPTVSRVPD